MQKFHFVKQQATCRKRPAPTKEEQLQARIRTTIAAETEAQASASGMSRSVVFATEEHLNYAVLFGSGAARAVVIQVRPTAPDVAAYVFPGCVLSSVEVDDEKHQLRAIFQYPFHDRFRRGWACNPPRFPTLTLTRETRLIVLRPLPCSLWLGVSLNVLRILCKRRFQVDLLCHHNLYFERQRLRGG